MTHKERRFKEALKKMPLFLFENFDPLRHKTIEDLDYIAQFEMELYKSQDESSITSAAQYQKAKAYRHMLLYMS